MRNLVRLFRCEIILKTYQVKQNVSRERTHIKREIVLLSCQNKLYTHTIVLLLLENIASPICVFHAAQR